MFVEICPVFVRHSLQRVFDHLQRFFRCLWLRSDPSHKYCNKAAVAPADMSQRSIFAHAATMQLQGAQPRLSESAEQKHENRAEEASNWSRVASTNTKEASGQTQGSDPVQGLGVPRPSERPV